MLDQSCAAMRVCVFVSLYIQVSADTPKAGDSIPAVWPSDHPNTYPTPLQTVSTSLADPLAVAPSDEVRSHDITLLRALPCKPVYCLCTVQASVV